MNKNLGLKLLAYSVLLAGLSTLVHYLAPLIARLILITGLVGGALCLFWGLRGMLGYRSKVGPILTLIPINYIMLSQTILSWVGGTQEVPGRQSAAAVITVLFATSFATLLLIVYAGVSFDVHTTKPVNNEETKSHTIEKKKS